MATLPQIIVIYGPTAVGKSSYALNLAKDTGGAIVCADSRQIYKKMNIGTASPSSEEKEEVPHILFNKYPLDFRMNASEYAQTVDKVISETQLQTLIICGGTGFYIDTLLYGMDSLPEISSNVKEEVKKLESMGIKALQSKLKNTDPDAYKKIDHQNPRRLVRALELTKESGKSLEKVWSENTRELRYEHIPIYIHMDRERLYDRINTRVDKMLDQGLLEEVKSLLPYRDLRSLDTVGYRELMQYFDGKYDLKEAIRLIKRNSRRYAKRQISWYRRTSDKWNVIEADSLGKMCSRQALNKLQTFSP